MPKFLQIGISVAGSEAQLLYKNNPLTVEDCNSVIDLMKALKKKLGGN